jgi:hypothetical protein
MMQYYQDRWTGRIRSQLELCRMIEQDELPRYQVGRRFRALPRGSCRLLTEAERLAEATEKQHECQDFD